MSARTSFEQFEKELNRLVESFGQRLSELKKSSYVEAQLRDDFLNPFFRALGWDMENRAGLIQQKREVEIESRTQIGGRQGLPFRRGVATKDYETASSLWRSSGSIRNSGSNLFAS